MSIKKPGIVMLVTLVSVFGLSNTASAGTCANEIGQLRAALNSDICAYGKRKRCQGLNRKLDRVERKIQKGKWRKAARKLANFHDVVENLAMRKKKRWINEADYVALMDPHFNAAAVCVSNGGYVDVPDTGDTGSETPEPPPPTVAF